MQSHPRILLDGDADRPWVWHATLHSRAAGKVSMLACAEVVLAVALYGWLALRWGLGWPVVGSVVMAPLLLLISPESVRMARRWFAENGYEAKGFKDWPWLQRWLCVAVALVVGCVALWVLLISLSALWRMDGNPILGWSYRSKENVFSSLVFVVLSLGLAAVIGVVVAALGAGVGVTAAENAAAFARKMVAAFAVTAVVLGGFALAFHLMVMDLGMTAIGFMVGGSVLGCLVVVFAAVLVMAGAVLGTALGLTLRAFVCSAGAMLQHLPQGLRQMGMNWRESTFCTDSCVPAELMPGLRAGCGKVAEDGIVPPALQIRGGVLRRVYDALLAAVFFLGALVYRMNLKAACWFWWPLGFVRPAVQSSGRCGGAER